MSEKKKNKYLNIVNESKINNVNPFSVISELVLNGAIPSEDKEILRSLLFELLDEEGISDELIKELFVDLMHDYRGKDITGYIKYMQHSMEVLRKGNFNLQGYYKYVRLSLVSESLFIVKYQDFKDRINELMSVNVSFIEVLEEFLDIKSFVTFKWQMNTNLLQDWVDSFETSKNYIQFKEEISQIDVKSFALQFAMTYDLKDFERCLEYIMVVKGDNSMETIEFAVNFKNSVPSVLNVLGTLCSCKEVEKVIMVLLINEYKDKSISTEEVMMSIKKYWASIFEFNNDIDTSYFYNLDLASRMTRTILNYRYLGIA